MEENNSPLENIKDEYEMLLQRQRIHQNKWIKGCKDWLKSLKDKGQPQNRWKPSGEQISCLARAINRCPSRTDEKILGELLKQLNKQASE